MAITSEPSPKRPPAGTARMQLSGVVGSTRWANGFWLLVGGVPLYADIATLATDFYGAFQTTLLSRMGVDAHLTRCDAEYYTAGGSIVAAAMADHVGSLGGEAEISSASTVISWQIEAVYRGGKPRTYLAAQASGQRETNHSWTDGHVNATQVQAVAFLTAVNGITTTHITNVSLGSLHFFLHGAALDPPQFSPYLGAAAQKRICTQRRRLGSEL